MKRIYRAIICCGLLIFINIGFLGALELEMIGGINNLTFHPDRTQPHSNSSNHEFQDYPYGFGNISLRNELTDSLDFSINFIRDNILQNTIDARLQTKTDRFSFEFGTFVGIYEDYGKPDAGIIGNIEIIFPGIVLLELGGSSSLGVNFDFTSENHREEAHIKIGFWSPFVIPSVSASTKSITWHIEANSLTHTIIDTLTRFQFSADFFAKNFPITLQLDGGYQTISRVYRKGNMEDIDEITSWFAGGQIKIQMVETLKLIAGVEFPLNVSTKEPVTTPNFLTLFKASAGFIYTF